MAKKNKAAEEMKEHLDPMEISRLHQMADAAAYMDSMDANKVKPKEVSKNGNK